MGWEQHFGILLLPRDCKPHTRVSVRPAALGQTDTPALSHQAGPAQELVSELTSSKNPGALGTPTAPLDPHSSPPPLLPLQPP